MTDIKRARRVRVNAGEPAYDGPTGRHRRRLDEVKEPVASEETLPAESSTPEETLIMGSQRTSRVDRVSENYPNMDINPITEIMQRMEVEGNLTLVIHRFSMDEWRVIVGERVPRITNPDAFEGRLPRNFIKDVLFSKEFVEWSKEWNKKSFEEKKAYADKHNISWDSDHPSERIQKKNLGYAVRCWLKIQKFRPQYSGPNGRAARKAAKENARIGPK